ncbi:MAG: hypothetical protein IPM01_17415 [Burkholderiaceae bacterium]|nr:hypothetical protein [Burkholderiaceae bacterium]
MIEFDIIEIIISRDIGEPVSLRGWGVKIDDPSKLASPDNIVSVVRWCSVIGPQRNPHIGRAVVLGDIEANILRDDRADAEIDVNGRVAHTECGGPKFTLGEYGFAEHPGDRSHIGNFIHQIYQELVQVRLQFNEPSVGETIRRHGTLAGRAAFRIGACRKRAFQGDAGKEFLFEAGIRGDGYQRKSFVDIQAEIKPLSYPGKAEVEIDTCPDSGVYLDYEIQPRLRAWIKAF